MRIVGDFRRTMTANKSTDYATLTSAPIAAGELAIHRPEFIRLPRTGVPDPITGLRRSTLNELVLPNASNNNKPQVRSIVLRKPGRERGIRLIHLGSLLAYLNRQTTEPARAA